MQGHHQFNSQAGGEKRSSLERVFFLMKHFDYFPSKHQKNVSSKALPSLQGVICGFQGFAERFK